MKYPNKIDSFVLNTIKPFFYKMIRLYITLFTNEHTRLPLITKYKMYIIALDNRLPPLT